MLTLLANEDCLDKALPTINASKAQVVVVCPRGKSGAKNS